MKIITRQAYGFTALLIIIVLLVFLATPKKANSSTVVAKPAPEFTQTSQEAWLGSEPLSISDLRGKVVLLDFWTFSCWNCYRSFPWLNALETKFKDKDFQVIGIHSPEFDREKDRDAVAANINKFKLKHPSMMDNDFAYWRAMGNRYWPTFYLIDKRGFIRHVFIGETHEGDARAKQVESAINQLLDEAS